MFDSSKSSTRVEHYIIISRSNYDSEYESSVASVPVRQPIKKTTASKAKVQKRKISPVSASAIDGNAIDAIEEFHW